MMRIESIGTYVITSQWKNYTAYADTMDEKGGSWFSDDEFIIGRRFGQVYISEVLRRHYLEQLQPCQPVFISAQMGAGKTTLIYDNLLPLMEDRGKNLLILSSRAALDLQIKKEIATRECPAILEELTEIGISKEHKFGRVSVWTYQSIYLKLQREPEYLKQFGAIVLDEVHFFESDAGFNVFTADCLEKLVKGSRHALRFYLTATPDFVFDAVAEMEKNSVSLTHRENIGWSCWKAELLLFDFRRDFSYVDVVFFKKHDEILNVIEKDTMDRKWIYFVSSRERGKEIYARLGEEKTEYLDSDSKVGENSEMFESLICTQKFERKVLITTKVLDVGVNIWDKKLTSIVIDSLNKCDFLQMLGRKRVKKGDRVTVYVKVPSKQEIGRRLGGCTERLQRWTAFKDNLKYGKLQNFAALPFPFYVEMSNKRPYRISWNALSFKNLENQISELEIFRDEEEENYAMHFLSWLNKDTTVRWLNPVVRPELEWLEKWLRDQVNVPMDRAQYDKFREELSDSLRAKSLIKLRSDRDWGINSINNFFTENNLRFHIENVATGIHKLLEG